MSVVWYITPTAAPLPQATVCFAAWRERGYSIAVIAENEDRRALPVDLCIVRPKYFGYSEAVNVLAKTVLERDPECQIVVLGGDDVYPCQAKVPEEIAAEFIEYFDGTLGLMQPHGDKKHHTHDTGKYIQDTAAWSPWCGREWCERAFMGAGPRHPDFFHYWGDTNLLDVAVWLGRYTHRPDIIQRDDNWKRSKRAHLGRPSYLYKAKAKSVEDKALYDRLKAEGYPGCGLLPVA
jgi:hypothetical protein